VLPGSLLRPTVITTAGANLIDTTPQSPCPRRSTVLKEKMPTSMMVPKSRSPMAIDNPEIKSADRSQVSQAEISDYIGSFYNATRCHSNLGVSVE